MLKIFNAELPTSRAFLDVEAAREVDGLRFAGKALDRAFPFQTLARSLPLIHSTAWELHSQTDNLYNSYRAYLQKSSMNIQSRSLQNE